MRRAAIAKAIAEAAGPLVRLVDARYGWPSILEVDIAGKPVLISAFVGLVHSMARKPYELRFQNPSKEHPIIVPPGTTPMLLGWTEEFEEPLVVSADPVRRIGEHKRQSYLHPINLLERARNTGWASYRSKSGEMFVALWPVLLPVELARRTEGLVLPDSSVNAASGSIEPSLRGQGATSVQVERQRALASRLIRSGRFSKSVLKPYCGRCAVSGIGLGAVVGAHIYPAAAPGAPDTIPNGLALTDTVHRLFDSHRLHIHPATLRIKVHPELIEAARSSSEDSAFLGLVRPSLMVPEKVAHRPDPMMFTRRYTYFAGEYDWVD